MYTSENAQTLLNEIPALKTCFKAFVIDLFQLGTSYCVSYEFCEELKERLKKEKIPNYFISKTTFIFTSLLIAAKVKVSIDETVLLILPHKRKTRKRIRTTYTIGLFKFTQNGYQLIKQKCLPCFEATPEFLRYRICGTSYSTPPNNIIVSTFYCKKIRLLKKVFKTSKNFVLLNDGLEYYRKDFIIETCKWLLDKSYIKFHILPVCDRRFHVCGYYGSDKNILDIIKIDFNELLPITMTATFTKSLPEIRIMFRNYTLKYETKTELPKNAHCFEITVKIDKENLATIKIQALEYKNFDTLPYKFNTLLKSKIPVIIFYDNSSVIATSKKRKGYKFLKEWNGMFGTDCFISFDQKKPKYGQNAMEMIKTKHTFVVFDLVKIMSMPNDDIEVDKTWGFTITNDSEHPVLLEFDNFDGTKKQASPEFLMALFLRQHFKAIKTETEETQKNIAFWILGHEFTEVENQRIKGGLKEACDLLRIEGSFVALENFKTDFIKHRIL